MHTQKNKFKKIFIAKVLILFTTFLFISAAHANNIVYETEWGSSKELELELKKMNGNRLYPCSVEGKVTGIEINYKGSFCPYPFKMAFFQSRWGMSDFWYTKNKKYFEESGFIEEFHSIYIDLSGNEIHQATWVLFDTKN